MYSVLLVDDEKSIREHLTKAIPFEKYGFTIRNTAQNGKEALEKLSATSPDLILLDVRMPVMDGLEFLKLLRQSEYANTQVIVLSGYNEFEYAKEAMKYGVKAYLNKPVDEDEMIPLLEKCAMSWIITGKKGIKQPFRKTWCCLVSYITAGLLQEAYLKNTHI